ncbi:ricin-type beta-trefoil lectin domain protein [Corallococcus sp. RDP092CA]|uniref:ricin-type beta-trefoil lectin domain protein n=1 Tax=Corallococcus sp. RDP092CA TaxID=3109369 RepID=UPI0035B24C4C
MKRLPGLFSTATALFAGATLSVAPSLAMAAPSQAEAALAHDVSPDLLSAMQRDLGLTADGAKRRLASEAAAVRVEGTLRAELGERFGGAWMSPDGSALVVGVTTDADADAVRRAGAVPQKVKYTLAELDAVKARLDQGSRMAGRAVHAWYVDVVTNSVVVLAQDSALTGGTDFVAKAGVKHAAVRTVPSREEFKPVYDLRGGDAYYPGNARCSIGFPVSGGFVTAGHCGGAGTTTSGFNGVAQGTVVASTFPGNDYAWVRTNGSWGSQPWVNNYAGGNVLVYGSQEAGINASVCRSGSTTGWRCGVIQQKNVTVNYSVGPVYGLTLSNACAEGGDSGGSWLSGNQAQGVTSGAGGNCTTGGTTVFQPLLPILSVYGLQLTTTGSGSGGPIIGLANKCIDVPNSNTNDGTRLQLWDCNGTNAQKWTFMSDGTVRAFGKCMDVAWGSSANGTAIQLVSCNGNPAQQFILSGAGDLVNPQANKCVDVTSSNSASGTPLQLWECNGTAAQKWRR